MTEVLLVLRDSECRLFEDAGNARLPAHHLAPRIQPKEGISLVFRAKEPGPGMALDAVRMDFSYGSFKTRPAEAYEASCTTRWRAIRHSSSAKTESSGHGRS